MCVLVLLLYYHSCTYNQLDDSIFVLRVRWMMRRFRETSLKYLRTILNYLFMEEHEVKTWQYVILIGSD